MQSLFQQRRKQIGGRLKKMVPTDLLEKWKMILRRHGLSLQSRPEQVPTEVWIELSASCNLQH